MIAASILIAATLLCVYLLAGYPLLLAAWRKFAPAVRKDPSFVTTVTVVMAVYNGETFIGRKLDNLLSLDYPAELLDIVVVSDGSTDATESIVQGYADRKVQLVKVPHGGKPAALDAGMQRATGELLFFVDVRQMIDPPALRHLVANFADPTVGAVTGQLRYIHSDRVGEAADIDIYWRYEIWARQKHSQIDSLFNTTGCVYAMRRSLAAPIPTDTLIDDAMIPLNAFFHGYRVVMDSDAQAFDYGVVTDGEFRRKMRTLSGAWQTWLRKPQLFTSSNRMRVHFLSHKFGRLLLPWLFLVAIGATIALPDGITQTVLLSLEGLVLLLAAIDPILPKNFLLRRLTSPARSFFVLNASSLLSVLVFFVPAERLWRPTRVSHSVADPLLAHGAEKKL